MNILFFLTPKNEVSYVYDNFTLKEVLEAMGQHTYSCVPVINTDGKYIGSITEGDLLWEIHNRGELSVEMVENRSIMHLPRKRDYEPVNIEVTMEDLIQKVMNQNFVPVIDDDKNFIGIVTRKSIINYCYNKMQKEE
ncbi:MAG: CBS domain-containing protein [Lachnospiraceae bacterium]|nr:CBS domain-containing protein [Lachnospiraceae bacterium]MDD3616122.1 CBS domain-containing protein [Lachnospiraceae bacterium]